MVTHLVSGLVVDGLDVAGEGPGVGRGEVAVGALLVPDALVPRLDVKLQRLVSVPKEVAVGALLGAVVRVGPAPGVATLSGGGTIKCPAMTE